MIPTPEVRRAPGDRWLKVLGAREHNLKDVDLEIPLGLFVCVTGVSGSGKSTLVQEVLLRALMQKVYRSRVLPGKHRKLIGWEQIDKVIDIDQSPIGRTPRSNPATYTGVFDHVRNLFSQVPGGSGSAATSPAGSRSTFGGAGARTAPATARSRSRCTSSPTST